MKADVKPAIKTSDLADKTGIAAGSIHAALAPALKRGDVVSCKVTPEPSQRVRLKTEPAARKASAGDVLRISLDDDGSLLLSNEDGVLELGIDQVLRLGDFLHATEGVWRP